MNNALAEIPVEKREILYIVEDTGTQLFLEKERKDPRNCTIATLAEIQEFAPGLSATRANSILIWDDFEKNYKSCLDLLNDPEKFTFELCNFCENYLGAVKGSIFIEEKKHTQDNTDIKSDKKGWWIFGSKKNDAKLNVSVTVNNNEKFEKRIKHEFNHAHPVPFNKDKAAEYYKAKGLDKFDVFKRMYEFRIEHGSDHDGNCCFESYIMEERKKLVSVAVDVALEMQDLLGVDVKIGFTKESLKEYSKTIKMEFTCK